MARVNLSFYKVLELPVDPQPDAIYYVFDEDNNVANWYVTTSEGVAIPASDIAAVETLVDAAIDEADTWTIVETAAAAVSPTAADSGTYYRMTNVTNPLLNLPTTGLVIGKTHFRFTFLNIVGQIYVPPYHFLELIAQDGSYFYGAELSDDTTVSEIHAGKLFEIRYIGTNRWITNAIRNA